VCLLKGDNHATAYRPKDDEDDDGEGWNIDFDIDPTVDVIGLVTGNAVKR